jgi:hypothetical protein
MAIDNTANRPPDWLLLLDSDPTGIQRQERAGQVQLVAPRPDRVFQLPRKGLDADVCKVLGMRVIGPSDGDALFMDVYVPDTLTVRANPESDSRWSQIVDADGTVIADMFYKAAFYDRDAFITFV